MQNSKDGKFLACQDNKILGIFDTVEAARAELEAEKERDKFWLFFKKRLLKKLLINHEKLSYSKSVYYIAEVKESEIQNPT